MTPIRRISRLRGCGVFCDFTWPADLADFGRYNLIYGWNGSGKTTISRVFRALEAKTPPSTAQVTLALEKRDVHGDEFAEVTLPVRVFNRDFMTESVFPVGGGDIPLIFVLGTESVEKQKEVQRLRKTLIAAQATLEFECQKKAGAETALDRFRIDRAKVIKDTLRSSGPNPYNSYDKGDFQARAQGMAAAGDPATHRLSEPRREKLLTQHTAVAKPKVEPLTYRLPALNPLVDAVSDQISATVVSATIQSLKDDAALSAWVHQGLGLHHDRHSANCLFCDQRMPQDRLAALEAHFGAEYEQFLKSLEALIARIHAASDATALSLPNRAELYEDLAEDYGAAETSVRAALESTRSYLDSLVQALTDKRGSPFQSLSFNVPAPEVDTFALDRLNEVIRKHNQACDDFQARAKAAREQLEADFVAGDLDEFLRLRDACQASVTSVEQAGAEVGRLNGRITALEREILEHRQPAEELNQDLQKYLGHDELRLNIKDTGYTITRRGSPAHALSEGETTAIALLYFLKSLQDRRFDLANGVVVLDDPVSSLDANALYLAFGLIRERTQQAAQLFIFTHNFTFFQQVRNWFRRLKGQQRKDVGKRPARFYMLDCAHEEERRCASIRWLDPLLERYESEYHYLFARIHGEATASQRVDLEQNYMLPNMARRLLEAFLAFRQPQASGDLWQKFQAVQFDEARKIRILRFLHTHSHSGAVGEPGHDLSLLSEARAVLKDLLDLIRSQDPQHFSAMEQLLAASADEGEVE